MTKVAFGHAVARIGDIDNDGVDDLVVGANFDDDGGTDRGAVWVLRMNANGTVKALQKISALEGAQGGGAGITDLADFDNFGSIR